MSKKVIIIKIASTIMMLVLALVIIYPLIFVLITSFKTNEDVILNPFGMATFQPGNYLVAWNSAKVGIYFMNSAIVTLVSLTAQTIIAIMAGYALGKLKVWGHQIIMTAFLAVMMVTSEMTIIPNFITIKNFGLMNTYWSLILPYIVGVAGGLVLGIYIVSNFVKTIPKELDEAAIIDGAGIIDILLKVDIPLIKPVISTLIIFNFSAIWSEFYWALIVVKSEAIKTLPLGLINLQSQYSANYGVLTAALVILSVPVMAIYIIFSKHFIAGATAGALKG